MPDLVNAINSLNHRDLFDYCSAFLPLLLSLVAIGIAIDTSKRQNKIALFEKRLELYEKLHSITYNWSSYLADIENVLRSGSMNATDACAYLCLSMILSDDTNELSDNQCDAFFSNGILDDMKVSEGMLEFSSYETSDLRKAGYLFANHNKEIDKFRTAYINYTDEISGYLCGKSSFVEFKKNTSEFKLEFVSFDNLLKRKVGQELKICE